MIPTDVHTSVYLVGAGPGDPGLLTLRAVECLRRADVVLYDYLVNPAALEHAAPGAELVRLGRPSTGRNLTPEQIAARMIEEARRGRIVVRLKGGDPSVFARGSDETGALREAGVSFEVVPGVTTGLAVAGYCEIPVTEASEASAVALVTARERGGKRASSLDYRALASFPGTLVFHMGVSRVTEWSGALLEHGKAPDTPVAIVRWCTRAAQDMVRCTLATVADVVQRRELRPPAVFVVGDVVDRAPDRSWFVRGPLFGTRVLVPGTPATSRKLRDALAERGAEVVVRPAIRVVAPDDWAPVDAALDALERYDWVVFSSANGVDHFLGRLFRRGGDVRCFGGVRLAVMGPGTASALARYHLSADLVPAEFVAESLARDLAKRVGGGRFLLVRGSQGRDVLARGLAAAGATVDQVAAYRSVGVEAPDPDVAAALSAGTIDWVAVTSAAIARSLDRLYGAALKRARLASIGPVTSAALRALGHEPAVEAAPHTIAGLVEAMKRGGRGAVLRPGGEV